MQWRKWCLRVNYCIPDIPETEKNNFNAYSKEIVSIWFYDDPIANEKTVRKLLHCFKEAELQVIKIDTETKIGHTGFVSRNHQESVWNIIRKSI
jgi:predicted alpha/beta hydrolase